MYYIFKFKALAIANTRFFGHCFLFLLFCFFKITFPGKWILFQLILGPKTFGEGGLGKSWEELKVTFLNGLAGDLPVIGARLQLWGLLQAVGGQHSTDVLSEGREYYIFIVLESQ